MRFGAAILVSTALAPAASACGRAEPAAADAAPALDRLAPLHTFEEERRGAVDFAKLPPSDRALGPDPIAIRALPGKERRWVGLLRGRDALVLLDAELREIARAAAPPLPTGLAVGEDGEICVTGEQSPRIRCHRAEGASLREVREISVAPRAFGLRDVALGAPRRPRSAIYAVDEREGALFAFAGDGPPKVVRACAGAFRVARAGEQLVVDCLLDHELAVFDLDRAGLPADAPRAVIRHDGPIWGFDAAATREGLWIAAGGVEDHPLDRREGSFGFIDSFVFVYRLAPGATAAEKLAEVNVSEHGVITPKALLLRVEGGRASGGARVTVTGYGGDRLAEIAFAPGFAAPPDVSTKPVPPGIASLAANGDALAFADPLFDAWIGRDVVRVPDAAAARSDDARVGEALFFTHLMAPWNRTEGRLSRFTCETCHFEGGVDGRTHHTGRGDVHATTKPLFGLLNNRPHFSRALDPDLATMVNNEFRVAGAKSDHDPWFSAADTGLAWIPLLGVSAADDDAIRLRRALMTFLADFTHRTNPAVIGRDRWGARERRGAEVFARRCERCHAARLVADAPSSRVPEERWEALVLSPEGPVVWGSNGYHRTGVEPYVHELGARAPSLRRLWRKRPYFTNGAAKSVREVLDRARWQGDAFWHDRAPSGAEALADDDREAVRAFLELL